MRARGPAAALVAVFVAVLATLKPCQALQDGESVTTARRGQFHQTRTQWHDLQGRHSPRMGWDQLVVVPLAQPKALLGGKDTYKISMAFDGGRMTTHWQTIIGTRVPRQPMLDIELSRMDDQIIGVKAKVLQVPPEYSRANAKQLAQFADPQRWPKHLLVRYRWKHQSSTNERLALYSGFLMGFLMAAAVIIDTVRVYQDRFQELWSDVASGKLPDSALAERMGPKKE